MITPFDNSLDSILGTFTKTQTKLNAFLAQREQRLEDLSFAAEDIVRQTDETIAERDKASKVLGKINEILG